jgi:hypothetical protein
MVYNIPNHGDFSLCRLSGILNNYDRKHISEAGTVSVIM